MKTIFRLDGREPLYITEGGLGMPLEGGHTLNSLSKVHANMRAMGLPPEFCETPLSLNLNCCPDFKAKIVIHPDSTAFGVKMTHGKWKGFSFTSEIKP